ncbi:hypothetical protein DIPPA_17346 [Diplonema papillatum]|nr:hypothetical protein DIPPA_17346 [Diplonema papillatum]
MVASGTLGDRSVFSFIIPFPPVVLQCPAVHELSFDDSTAFPHSVVDTSFSAEGGGSAYFGRPGDVPIFSIFSPVLDLYTSFSYYVAMNGTESPPGIDILQADQGSSCWKMNFATTGLTFTSDTVASVNMPLELNRFYFVEHLIDYSTGMMTVRVDGEVKHENFASSRGSRCTSTGIGHIVFLYRGWLDEFEMQPPCPHYELTGTLAKSVHTELVDGGLMLTVTIKGDLDVWVDTEATKQAFIDGLVADSSSTALTGWNALKSTMMNTSLVSISGSKMTLGPLKPAASFLQLTSTVVSLKLKTSMVLSRGLRDGSGDLSFVIPRRVVCAASEEETFDVASTAFPGSVVDTKFNAVGAGSAYFGGGYSFFVTSASKQFSSISFYLARSDDTDPGFDILDDTGASCWAVFLGKTGLSVWSVTTTDAPMTVANKKFYFIELLIDYRGGTMSTRLDGQVMHEQLTPKTGSKCVSAGFAAFVFLAEGWLDEFQLQC